MRLQNRVDMKISLTKLRSEMFRILPNLKDDEELTVMHEGKAAYIIKKTHRNRHEDFLNVLKRCPKLTATFDEMISFKNEGRK
jgi:hypothetical protein